jgi:predicted CopG family antitoxin
LSKYSTISVPEEVKKALEKAKGEREWGTYLLNLYVEANTARRAKAFEQLVEKLSNEDLESIIKSSKELRERFKFR